MPRALYASTSIALGAIVMACGRPPPVPRESPTSVPDAAAEAGPVSSAEGEADAGSDDGGSVAADIPIDEPFAGIDLAVNDAIAAGKTPGAVVLVGRHDAVLFERAYGSRSLEPTKQPMAIDTVFDLASLTKPLATATSIMLLVEKGNVDLDAPAQRYVPELAKLPPFTVKQLLMHTSGLPAATPISDYATDRATMIRKLGDLKPKHQPDERFLYSDVGYVILEEIVRRVTKKDFAAFTREAIYERLGMMETGFLPPDSLKARAALTEPRDGQWVPGLVHDPRARVMGGVAGHAGLFSTAGDLSRYARMMLDKGTFAGVRLFEESTVTKFEQKPDSSRSRWGRALGWDVDSGFASHKSPSFSPQAFGHGGYTGTAMWIDPVKDLFLVFLSNRVHPDGKGAVNPTIAIVGTLAASAIETKTGIDVLRAESFARLDGAKIGLVTNGSARAKDGKTTLDVLRGAPNVSVKAIFTPEHGLGAEREGKIKDSTYEGIPIYSLYGERFAPTDGTLDGIDTLVFDLQDAGTRFYTYASTMKRAMKVAAEKKLRFVVLDRPNPLNGVDVQGPMLPAGTKSFVNHHPLPVRHGMTMGELAKLFAADDAIDVKLDVVRMASWRRRETFDRTGLVWTPPSPNLRTVDEVLLYPAVGLLEGTNVSVGRGTSTPFELLGAPWLDGEAMAAKLSAAKLPGVTFEATSFTPTAAPYAGKKCGGVQLKLVDRATFDAMKTSVMLAIALREVHEADWEADKLEGMLGSASALAAIKDKKPYADVEATWAKDLAAFRSKRERFLLYR